MPIPSQNEFLLPFLDILSADEIVTRAKLMCRLARHLDISENEAQYMSGRQFTRFSRSALVTALARQGPFLGCRL